MYKQNTKPLECSGSGEPQMWWVNYWAYRMRRA